MAAEFLITTPVPGFTGTVAGVKFTNGRGTTREETATSYFRRHGYEVTPTESKPAAEVTPTEGKPAAPATGKPAGKGGAKPS
jgi:hypothetical protein